MGNLGSTMTEIALFEAKNRLSQLIDRVQTGEVIVIILETAVGRARAWTQNLYRWQSWTKSRRCRACLLTTPLTWNWPSGAVCR